MRRCTGIAVPLLLLGIVLQTQAKTTTVRLYRNDGNLDSNVARRAANQLVSTRMPSYWSYRIIIAEMPISAVL